MIGRGIGNICAVGGPREHDGQKPRGTNKRYWLEAYARGINPITDKPLTACCWNCSNAIASETTWPPSCRCKDTVEWISQRTAKRRAVWCKGAKFTIRQCLASEMPKEWI